MRHMLECPVFSLLSLSLPLLPAAFCFGDGLSRIRLWEFRPLPPEALLSAILYIDVIFTVYHDLKRSSPTRINIMSTLNARLHQQIRRCDAFAPLVGTPAVLPPGW